jgi:murein DD-endopeptidase MepM/ murein hydrolase activator NlpD
MKYVAFCLLIIGAWSFEKSRVTAGFPNEYLAEHFDWPVGKPNGEGYYNAQAFGENNHLGEDLNANTGGNSDLGDPVYSIANGKVSFAEDIQGGWGNIIRIVHELPDGSQVESLYAHCDEIKVKKGDWLKRGDQIGTIGDAHGQYYAHLHFELRSIIGMPIGGGYSENQKGYLNPLKYIKMKR